MEIRVSVDSIIDIITNSSTEIFTFPSDNAEELLKKVVNEVLVKSGSELEFDDVFSIKRILGQDVMDDFSYWLEENQNLIGCDSDLNPCKDIDGWIRDHKEESEKLMEKYFSEQADYGEGKYSSGGKNCGYDFIITTKTGVDTDIVDNISGIFSSQEYNC